MDQNSSVLAKFSGKIVFIGFGSITVATLPLILKHIDVDMDKIIIISPESEHWDVAEAYGISYRKKAITEKNYKEVFHSIGLDQGDAIINLSVSVSSLDLIKYCHENGILYVDTCIEAWEGFYDNPELSSSARSNYTMREEVLKYKEEFTHGPTAIVAHGANPGMVNHLIKRAILEIAELKKLSYEMPKCREDWGRLAKTIGLKTVQISERDTQQSEIQKHRGEFCNTWSVDGFISEGIFQPAELGWGIHEKTFPTLGFKHPIGCGSAIYIDKPGASIKVKGWTPDEGPYHGFLVTHNESVSLADYFTVRDNNSIEYRPTVFYCYHPCDAAVSSVHEILGHNSEIQTKKRLMIDEIVSGVDELGVLLLGDFGEFTGYWHGSNLSIEQARALSPHCNATSLQVAAGVLGAFVWAIENPEQGLLEPEELDHVRVLNIMDPYLGTMVSKTTNWTPLQNLGMFNKNKSTDTWQFNNFLP